MAESTKAPKNYKGSLKERPPSVLKPGRERGVLTKRTQKLKSPPPPNVGSKREKPKLALKGGGRAYGRNS